MRRLTRLAGGREDRRHPGGVAGAESRAFREIDECHENDEFHEAARVDLGVQGNVTCESHPERGLLRPAARRDRTADS